MPPAPLEARLALVFPELRAGRLAEAERLARALADEHAGDARPHALLAHVLNLAGRREEALAVLATALALDPSFPPALVEQAQLARAAGDQATAAAALERLLALQPDNLAVAFDLATSLLALGRYAEAAQRFEQVLAREPDHARALDGYAKAALAAGVDHERAIAARRRLVELEPGSAAAWMKLAFAYEAAERLPEQIEACKGALAADPKCLSARWELFQAPPAFVLDEAQRQAFRRSWHEGLAFFEQVALDDPRHRAHVDTLLSLSTNFHLHYLGEALLDAQRRYAAVVARLAHTLVPPTAPPRTAPGARLRVGFVSPFLRRHTVTKLFRSLIEGLPRERFALELFHCGGREDEVSASLRARADFYLQGDWMPREWVQRLRERRLDALVFLDIGMHPTPQALAAYRFAPLQCMLWGHPVTSGSPEIDCFLTADAMEAEDGQRNYSERLVRLPRLGTCYAAPDREPDPTYAVPGADEAGAVHYFVAQSVFKLTPAHDDVFARIAAAVPQARFRMLPHPRPHVVAALAERMRPAFARHGVALERHLRFLPYLTEAEFLAVARSSDVNLDSFDWSGGNTTLEISWQDVPTLTLPGTLMRSRHSYAIDRLLGLDELVARDVDDYVRIAVELGRDAGRRHALKAAIGERKHALYDDRGVVEAFARFIESEVAKRS